LETLLSHRHEVLVWDRDLTTGEETQPLEEAARDRQVVVFALPTQPHDELAGRLVPCLQPDALCCPSPRGWTSGAHCGAGVHAALRIADRWGLLYGRCWRANSRRPQWVALSPQATGRKWRRPQGAVCRYSLRLQVHEDVQGAAWAAVLKNVYVPLVGAADGLGMGDNMRGFLIAAATHELADIVEHQGGRRDTAYTLGRPGRPGDFGDRRVVPPPTHRRRTRGRTLRGAGRFRCKHPQRRRAYRGHGP
jgi:glycerol-3-phosphate dehydrogenase (NAD(P)+)